MSSPVTPLPANEVSTVEEHAAHESLIHHDGVAIDDLINALSGGNLDETISARMARWATEDTGWKQHVGSEVCKGLNLIQKDHGAKAELGDLTRAEEEVKTEEDTPTFKEE